MGAHQNDTIGMLLGGALVLPFLHLFCAVWAHLRAFPLGYLHTGALLGAVLGPLGVLMAGVLTPRPRPSMEIARQFQAREERSVELWLFGLILLAGGSAVALYQAAWLLLDLPPSKWTWRLLGLAGTLYVWGVRCLYAGVPPEKRMPPLGDYAEYEDSDPAFAAELRAAHTAYRQQQSQENQQTLFGGTFVLGAVFVLAGCWLLFTNGALTRDTQLVAWGAGLAAAGLLTLGLGSLAAARRVRRAAAERAGQLERHLVETYDGPPLPPADLLRVIREGLAADRLSDRSANYRTTAIIALGCGALALVKAGLGYWFNIEPVTGNAALWFLLPGLAVVLGPLLLLRSRVETTRFEAAADAAADFRRTLNERLGDPLAFPIPPYDIAPPPALLAAGALWLVVLGAIVLLVTGWVLGQPNGTFVWLGLGVAAGLAAYWLDRRVPEPIPVDTSAPPPYWDDWDDEDDEARDPEVQEARRQYAEYLEELKPVTIPQHPHDVRISLSFLAVLSGVLFYGGLGLTVLTLADGLSAPKRGADFGLFYWPLVIGGLLTVGGALLVSARGSLEDSLQQLAAQAEERYGYRQAAIELTALRRIERTYRISQRVLCTGLWLAGHAAYLLWAVPHLALYNPGAYLLPFVWIWGGLGIAGTVGAAVRLAQLLPALRRAKAATAAGITRHHELQAAAALSRSTTELVTEQHGHFTVQYPARPEDFFEAAPVERIVRAATSTDPVLGRLDFYRSVCWFVAASAFVCLVYFNQGESLYDNDLNYTIEKAQATFVLGTLCALVLGWLARRRVKPDIFPVDPADERRPALAEEYD